MTTEPATDTGADWVDAARRKWADYQRVLGEAPDNHIAAGIRERGLVDMVPHLIAAYEDMWTQVEAWLKRHRDEHVLREPRWYAINGALDDLRDHMHTGTPLDQTVQGPHPEES